MISCISYRNFLVLLAAAAFPTSVSSFNPANKPILPITNPDAMEGLKATTIDNVSDNTLEEAWSSVTQLIHSKMEEMGGEESLSEEKKDEIVATAVAGSVLGTVVGSHVMVGAALGFAGSQMLQGENGEKAKEAMGKAGKDMMHMGQEAFEFTKHELEHEKDLSKVSAKILMALQDKTGTLAGEIKTDLEASPALMAEKFREFAAEQTKASITNTFKKTVENDEFKNMPQRSFNKFKAFLESEEVMKAKSGAMQAIKDGLESEEVKALQSRASKAVQDGLESDEVKALQSRASKSGAMQAIKHGLESEEVKALQEAIKDGLESDEVKALQSRASKAVQNGIDTASSKITKA